MTRSTRFLSGVVNSSSTSPKTVVAEAPEGVAVEFDFVVILAALLCAIICVLGLTAVARCAWLRRGAAGNPAGQPLSKRGLQRKVLQSLPKLTYDSSSGVGKLSAAAAVECAICLAEYANGDEIRVLPQCGHAFHVGCIDTWLGSHSSCPSCRQLLVVTRCQMCGEFPSVGAPPTVTEMKERQDGGCVVASSGIGLGSGFLP